MPYTPLTEEQFNKAKQSGFSADQIIQFEQKRKKETTPMFKTEAEGRNALAKRQSEQKQLEFEASLIGFPVSQALGGINTAINTATGNVPELIANKMSVSTLPNTLAPVVKSAGEAAGFMAPGGAPSKMLGMAEKIANPLVRGAVGGGASMATQLPTDATSKEDFLGKINKNIGVGTLLGGGVGALEGAVKGAKPALEGASQRIYNSIIKPLKKDFAYAKNPGRGLAGEGLVFNDLEHGQKVVGDRLNQRMTEYEQNIANNPAKISVSQEIENALSKAKKQAVDTNNEALLKEVNKIEQAIKNKMKSAVNPQTGETQIVPEQTVSLDNISLKDALDLKRKIGNLTNYTGSPSDMKAVNQVKQDLYRIVRRNMERVAPETRGMNETIADLIGAKNAMSHRAAIEGRSALLGFPEHIMVTGGALGSMATHSPESILGGLALVGVKKAMQSPAIMTRLASMLQRMSAADIGKILSFNPALGAKVREIAEKAKMSLSGADLGMAGKIGKENALTPEVLDDWEKILRRDAEQKGLPPPVFKRQEPKGLPNLPVKPEAPSRKGQIITPSSGAGEPVIEMGMQEGRRYEKESVNSPEDIKSLNDRLSELKKIKNNKGSVSSDVLAGVASAITAIEAILKSPLNMVHDLQNSDKILKEKRKNREKKSKYNKKNYYDQFEKKDE